MTTPKETLWELDPHTKAKHEILGRYLAAWFPILSAYHSRIVYIDGFSGPGRYKQGESGSPMIALDVAVNHRKSIDAGKDTLAPTFAFIDPFGFSGIPFPLIERFLKCKKSEAFVTFMVDAINRFLEHPEDKVVQHIVAAFGTEEAVQIAKGPGEAYDGSPEAGGGSHEASRGAAEGGREEAPGKHLPRRSEADMGLKSAIEWTESTWNPVTGCTKISPGCKHCYAERMAERLQAMGQDNYRNGFRLTLQPHMLELPLRWKKPQTIFVNSMSDLFHKDVPLEYIQRVFDVMHRAHGHRFQVLTKRSERLAAVNAKLKWASNIWMGVSVESDKYCSRIDDLRSTDALIKFLSLEPLLGPLHDLDLQGIDWVIVGGESGPMARPMDSAWAADLRDQCRRAKVPFFFKQWGGRNKKQAGRVLGGRTWDQVPDDPVVPTKAPRNRRVSLAIVP